MKARYLKHPHIGLKALVTLGNKVRRLTYPWQIGKCRTNYYRKFYNDCSNHAKAIGQQPIFVWRMVDYKRHGIRFEIKPCSKCGDDYIATYDHKNVLDSKLCGDCEIEEQEAAMDVNRY